MKKLIPFALMALLTACQSTGSPLASNAAIAVRSAAASPPNPVSQPRLTQPSLPWTAKVVDEDAENLSRDWSPNRALVHVLAQNILSDGTPHKTSGSFLFSFIDTQHRDRGFQVLIRQGEAPETKEVPASRLPQLDPLEIRAWNLDSSKAIIRGRELFGQVSLKRFELTGIQGRLVWVFGKDQIIEAFNGVPYTP